jgi:hypothetical protein
MDAQLELLVGCHEPGILACEHAVQALDGQQQGGGGVVFARLLTRQRLCRRGARLHGQHLARHGLVIAQDVHGQPGAQETVQHDDGLGRGRTGGPHLAHLFDEVGMAPVVLRAI